MKNYFKNIYQAIVTILIGLGVTFRHLFVHAVTIQYPHVKRELPPRSRQKLFVNIDDCIGCLQCARACPVDCITIETIKAGKDEDLGVTSNGQKKRLHVVKFDIDMSLCCYCADCVFPCPTECIYMTPEYEFATYNREDLLIHFAKYTPEQIDALRQREQQKKEALAKAKAARANTAASESKKPNPNTAKS